MEESPAESRRLHVGSSPSFSGLQESLHLYDWRPWNSKGPTAGLAQPKSSPLRGRCAGHGLGGGLWTWWLSQEGRL